MATGTHPELNKLNTFLRNSVPTVSGIAIRQPTPLDTPATVVFITTGQYSGKVIEVTFLDTATDAQKIQALFLANNFDIRQRRPRSVVDIYADLQALTNVQKLNVCLASSAYLLSTNPEFATAIKRAFNLDITTDELDPDNQTFK